MKSYGVCVNHHCSRFEYRVPASDGDTCSDCGQLLCHESGLTWEDADEGPTGVAASYSARQA